MDGIYVTATPNHFHLPQHHISLTYFSVCSGSDSDLRIDIRVTVKKFRPHKPPAFAFGRSSPRGKKKKKKKTQAREDTSSGAAWVRPTLHASSVPRFVLVHSSDAEEGQKNVSSTRCQTGPCLLYGFCYYFLLIRRYNTISPFCPNQIKAV